MSRYKRNPRDEEGHSKFEEMEKKVHTTYQQLSDAQSVVPGESVAVCPNCIHIETLPIAKESAESAKRRAASAI